MNARTRTLIEKATRDAESLGHFMGFEKGPNKAGVVFSYCRVRSCKRSVMVLPGDIVSGSALISPCQKVLDRITTTSDEGSGYEVQEDGPERSWIEGNG